MVFYVSLWRLQISSYGTIKYCPLMMIFDAHALGFINIYINFTRKSNLMSKNKFYLKYFTYLFIVSLIHLYFLCVRALRGFTSFYFFNLYHE